VQIRLVGTEDECRTVAGRLDHIVDVQEISGPRARRGDSRLVQMYAEATVGTSPGRMVPWSTPEDQAAASAAVCRLSDSDRAIVLAHLTGYVPSIVLEAVESTGKGAERTPGAEPPADACVLGAEAGSDPGAARAALHSELEGLKRQRKAWDKTARACTCPPGLCSRRDFRDHAGESEGCMVCADLDPDQPCYAAVLRGLAAREGEQ
jgi:hypothetical protein